MPERIIDFSKPIPLFPLPQCVLLPHATIPLHIFEPRYRTMVADSLDSHGLIAMACFKGSRWRTEYEGSPPIRPTACIGYIVQHHTLGNGCYNILLQGLLRAKIVEEEPYEPYRRARFAALESAPVDDARLADQRSEIERLLNHEQVKKLATVNAIQNWLSDDIPTVALFDLASMTLCEDGEKRYRWLEECCVHRRAELLIEQLLGLKRTLVLAGKFGSGKSDEGYPLN